MSPGFTWSEREFIADVATAVKWHLEILIENGMPFEEAKRQAIAAAEVGWKGLRPDMREAARAVSWSISPADLSPRTIRAVKDRIRKAIEDKKGKPLGWFDRFLWRWFGVVWTI